MHYLNIGEEIKPKNKSMRDNLRRYFSWLLLHSDFLILLNSHSCLVFVFNKAIVLDMVEIK